MINDIIEIAKQAGSVVREGFGKILRSIIRQAKTIW
jgi:hypothetical protein